MNSEWKVDSIELNHNGAKIKLYNEIVMYDDDNNAVGSGGTSMTIALSTNDIDDLRKLLGGIK